MQRDSNYIETVLPEEPPLESRSVQTLGHSVSKLQKRVPPWLTEPGPRKSSPFASDAPFQEDSPPASHDNSPTCLENCWPSSNLNKALENKLHGIPIACAGHGSGVLSPTYKEKIRCRTKGSRPVTYTDAENIYCYNKYISGSGLWWIYHTLEQLIVSR